MTRQQLQVRILMGIIGAFLLVMFFTGLFFAFRAFVSVSNNPNNQVFLLSDGSRLITKIEHRSDGLINWDREVICFNGDRQPWESGIGYSLQEYHQRFEIQGWPILTTGKNVIHIMEGQTYMRPTGC